MNVLVLFPNLVTSRLEVHQVADNGLTRESKVLLAVPTIVGMHELRHAIDQACAAHAIDLAAIYSPLGMRANPGPLLVDDASGAEIESTEARAPLALPAVRQVLGMLAEALPQAPRVLLAGSDFFAHLPARERHYAIEPALTERYGLERTGFHGLFHHAAVDAARAARGEKNHQRHLRVLSVCLEPRPEAAALRGDRPLLVTSGATPLEGLPGDTSSGELDPGMLLLLAKEQGWSPEEIADLLMRESGLRGLVGRPVTLKTLFESEAPDGNLARELFRYRLLQTAGSALAALGGLDTIVFTGRYAAVGRVLGPWLLERLAALPGKPQPACLVREAAIGTLVAAEATRFACERAAAAV